MSSWQRLLGQQSPWLMGIVNVTPDSFADGGLHASPEAACRHARALKADGAAIVDIGGESTAPGRAPVSAEIEMARIEPVISTLAPDMVLSIDTYRAGTAARGLALGARIINDVSALRADPAMGKVVAEHDAFLVMMHSKDAPLPHASDQPRVYQDVALEIGDFLCARIDAALHAGIPAERLAVDPGWGRFVSIDPEDSWRLLKDFSRLVERVAPIPVMVATSRKGSLGVPMADRDPVSQLTALAAVRQGASLIRTHNVKMAQQFLVAARKISLLP